MRSWPASAAEETAPGTAPCVRILGLDPGLRHTGWGIIEARGNRLSFVADGVLEPDPKLSLAARLKILFEGVQDLVTRYAPHECAIEDTFVNQNPASTLKLGHARAAAMLAPANAGIPVAEYKPNLVKKSVVGAGHAQKAQIAAMMRVLLPGSRSGSEDAADALAVAICHAHHRASAKALARQGAPLEHPAVRK
ncbi:MAG: crossover junction endodeoxyribonuclease RuvC [Rhodospirillaceae bacterium]